MHGFLGFTQAEADSEVELKGYVNMERIILMADLDGGGCRIHLEGGLYIHARESVEKLMETMEKAYVQQRADEVKRLSLGKP